MSNNPESQAQTQNEQKKEALSTFRFQGNQITFKGGETVMVNATEMAKPFGKRPSKWLELPTTREFLKTLCDVRKSDITSLVITAKGNSASFEQGTWMHELIDFETDE